MHVVATAELAQQGVLPTDLKNLVEKICDLGDNSKLAQTLSGQLMGFNISSGTKTPWELNTEVLPYYVAAAFGLTTRVLRRPIAYKGFYHGYIKRVTEAMELVGNDVGFQNDLEHVVQIHAKSAHMFVGSYYQCYYIDRDNFAGAMLHISSFAGKLFALWDTKIKLIKALQDARSIRRFYQNQEQNPNHEIAASSAQADAENEFIED
jgi:hypothetical protein